MDSLLNPRLHLAKQHSEEFLYLKVSVCLSATAPTPQSLKYTNFILPQETITEWVTTQSCHVTGMDICSHETRRHPNQARCSAVSQIRESEQQKIKLRFLKDQLVIS